METVCTYCGEFFFASRKDAKYCGDACKQASFRDRKNAEKNKPIQEEGEVETEFSESDLMEEILGNQERYSEPDKKSNMNHEDYQNSIYRTIQVNDYFSGFVLQLRKLYGKNILKSDRFELLEQITEGLSQLKTEYRKVSMKDYSYYEFREELEYLHAELSFFISEINPKKDKAKFEINKKVEHLLNTLEVEFQRSSREIREH